MAIYPLTVQPTLYLPRKSFDPKITNFFLFGVFVQSFKLLSPLRKVHFAKN